MITTTRLVCGLGALGDSVESGQRSSSPVLRYGSSWPDFHSEITHLFSVRHPAKPDELAALTTGKTTVIAGPQT